MNSPAARRAAIAAALVLLAGAAWAAIVLLRDSRHDVLPNVVPPGTFVEDIAPRREACQPIEPPAEPADTAVLTVGTYARPSARVELVARAGRRAVARSGVVTAANGAITLPLRPALRPSDGAVLLCLRNRSTGRIAVAGIPYPAPPGGVPGRDLSIRLVGSDSASHASRASLTLDRFAAARAGNLGGWVLALALSLFAGAAIGAVALLVREARRA